MPRERRHPLVKGSGAAARARRAARDGTDGDVVAATPPPDEVTPPPAKPLRPPSNLRAQVARGLGWRVLSQGFQQVSRIAVSIVLAHLLTPHDYGLAGMALLFTGFAAIFTDLSLGAALVQRAEITEADRSTVFWATLGSGLVLTAAGIAIAPLAGAFFSTTAVVPLVAATAPSILLNALPVTQQALLTREMNFRAMSVRSIAATFGGSAIAVAAAFAGFGPWAIIAQTLSTAAIAAVLIWVVCPWRPSLTFSRTSLMTLGTFGVNTLGAKIMSYLNLNADNLLIGRSLGTRALGIYSVAYNVMFFPASQIAAPIQQVLFAAFVKLQHDNARLGAAWTRGARLIAAILVPAFLGMAAIAPDFVRVILGSRWLPSAPVLQLLCLAGVAQSFQLLNWSVIQAAGQSWRLLRFMTFSTVVTVTAFVVGLRWGILGVAGLFAVARLIVTIVYTRVTCATISVPILPHVRRVVWPALIAFPMATIVYVVRLGLVDDGIAPAMRLVILLLLGGGLYVGLVLRLTPDVPREIGSMLRRRTT